MFDDKGDMMDELLREIGINYKGEKSKDGSYVVDLPDSAAFGRVFSLLDKSDVVEPDDESSQLTAETTSMQFVNEEYTITLLGDLENDSYKVVIREN